MNGFLLDTNVISELMKPAPDENVGAWINEAEESMLYLSVLTLGEIRNGIENLRPSARRTTLDSWLRIHLYSRFERRILPIDAAIAERWGVLAAIARRKGKPIPVTDGLLAATALHHDLTFVTRNIADVAGTGVATLNPWE